MGGARRRHKTRPRGHEARREQQVRLRQFSGDRQTAHDAPMVRRHATSVGVQARLASGAVAHRSRHGLRGRGRRRPVPLDRRRNELARTARPPRARHRAALAARSRRHVLAHDPSRSQRSQADLHRDFSGRRVSHRRRRHDVEADQQADFVRSTFPIRMPRSATAFTTSR